MRYNCLLFLVLLYSTTLFCQLKQERESRISKAEFPTIAIELLQPYTTSVKRLRFYKEQDGKKFSYEAKFKKDRLRYSVEFSENGQLEDVEFIIKAIDIPDESFNNIQSYLQANYRKHRIKKIQQQYVLNEGTAEALLKTAFQNLLNAKITYELIVATKDKDGFSEYEITFNAQGAHLSTRRSIDPNYDHVLYH